MSSGNRATAAPAFTVACPRSRISARPPLAPVVEAVVEPVHLLPLDARENGPGGVVVRRRHVALDLGHREQREGTVGFLVEQIDGAPSAALAPRHGKAFVTEQIAPRREPEQTRFHPFEPRAPGAPRGDMRLDVVEAVTYCAAVFGAQFRRRAPALHAAPQAARRTPGGRRTQREKSRFMTRIVPPNRPNRKARKPPGRRR